MTQSLQHAQGELLGRVRLNSGNSGAPITLYQTGNLRTEITLIFLGLWNDSGTDEQVVQLYHDDTGTTYTADELLMTVRLRDPTVHATIPTWLPSTSSPLLLFQAQHPGSGIHVKPGGSIGISLQNVATEMDIAVSCYGITQSLAERVRGLT